MGLRAGLNTYNYVGANPTGAFDPFGLETVVIINNNGMFGSHVGYFIRGFLSDPGGHYQIDRNYECGCDNVPSIDDYIKYQKEDGPEVITLRFNTTREEENEILKRDVEGSTVGGGLCATNARNMLSGIGPFKNLSTTFFETPNGLYKSLKEILDEEKRNAKK